MLYVGNEMAGKEHQGEGDQESNPSFALSLLGNLGEWLSSLSLSCLSVTQRPLALSRAEWLRLFPGL